MQYALIASYVFLNLFNICPKLILYYKYMIINNFRSLFLKTAFKSVRWLKFGLNKLNLCYGDHISQK